MMVRTLLLSRASEKIPHMNVTQFKGGGSRHTAGKGQESIFDSHCFSLDFFNDINPASPGKMPCKI